MDKASLGDFQKGLGGQAEPFIGDTKNDGRHFSGDDDAFFPGKMEGVLATIFGGQLAVEQLEAGGGINGAVAAVDEFLEFGTIAFSVNTDFVPAGVKVIVGFAGL